MGTRLPSLHHHFQRAETLEKILRRCGAHERLFAFLGLPVTPELRAHFATNVAQEKFNQGRYRSEVAKDQLTEFEVEYERVLARLDADNVPRPV